MCCSGTDRKGCGTRWHQGVTWAQAKIRLVPDIRLEACSDLCLCSDGVPCNALIDGVDGGCMVLQGWLYVCVCVWGGGACCICVIHAALWQRRGVALTQKVVVARDIRALLGGQANVRDKFFLRRCLVLTCACAQEVYPAVHLAVKGPCACQAVGGGMHDVFVCSPLSFSKKQGTVALALAAFTRWH